MSTECPAHETIEYAIAVEPGEPPETLLWCHVCGATMFHVEDMTYACDPWRHPSEPKEQARPYVQPVYVQDVKDALEGLVEGWQAMERPLIHATYIRHVKAILESIP